MTPVIIFNHLFLSLQELDCDKCEAKWAVDLRASGSFMASEGSDFRLSQHVSCWLNFKIMGHILVSLLGCVGVK